MSKYQVTIHNPIAFRPAGELVQTKIFVTYIIHSDNPNLTGNAVGFPEIEMTINVGQMSQTINYGNVKSRFIRANPQSNTQPYVYHCPVRYLQMPFDFDIPDELSFFGPGAVNLADLSFSITIDGVSYPMFPTQEPVPIIEIEPCLT